MKQAKKINSAVRARDRVWVYAPLGEIPGCLTKLGQQQSQRVTVRRKRRCDLRRFSSLVTSSSRIQKSPYLGEPTGFDGFGIGKTKKQDQKRPEEPRCQVRGCGIVKANHTKWMAELPADQRHDFQYNPRLKRKRR